MSENERNKGKLIPIGVDTEHFTGDDFDAYDDAGYVIIDREVYEVAWEIFRDTDSTEFADVKENEDGSIDFHTYHYNGGAHWTEVVGAALRGKS